MGRYVDSGGNQPIILFLREWVPTFFPSLIGRGQHVSGIGGYNNSPGRGAHIEGRAADIYVNVNRRDLKIIGDALFKMFIDRGADLGVENVTWNRRTWENGRDAVGVHRRYTGPIPHTDHLHVSFTREASQLQPPSLITHLKKLASSLGESLYEALSE